MAVDGTIDGAVGPTVTVAEGYLVPHQVVAGQPAAHVCKIERIGIVVVGQPFNARHGASELVLARKSLQCERRGAVLRTVVVEGRGEAHVLVECVGQRLQGCGDGHGIFFNYKSKIIFAF